GKVKQLILVDDIDELKQTLKKLNNKKINYNIIGETTNILFTSSDIDGTLIKLSGDFRKIKKINDTRLYVGAGCWVPRMAKTAMSYGLSGLEHTIGIPGSFGGLIRMNGGSQRRGISESIVNVSCINDKLELIKI
ncbi:FAD-binding protein, partial [Photobacterium sanguinicancri]